MKTEFLIPFEIDTSAIEQRLESDAYDEVVKELVKKFESSLPKRYGTTDWERVAWMAIEKFIDKHADEVVDMTVLLLAEKVGNRKRGRDVLKEIRAREKED
jgi:hypothetical protein